ncbi:MAG: hypothetical protein KA978_19080 [Deltaproteobacteria bacterium]|nr:hypothetical protein [Deltaproteobacteria bacterium]
MAYVVEASDFPCSGPLRWPGSYGPGVYNHPNYRMCHVLPTGGDPGLDMPSISTAVGWAHWLWQMDDMTYVPMFYQTSTCWADSVSVPDGNWFDDDETNQWSVDAWQNTCPFYESNSYCMGLAARTGENTETCISFGAQYRLAADVAITVNPSATYTDENTDTVTECTGGGFFLDAVMLHEIGHIYGLQHNDAWMTTMNSAVGAMVCNAGMGFHPQPMGDDIQALMHLAGRSQVGVFDLAGATSIRTAAGATVIQQGGFINACATSSVAVSFTSTNRYSQPGSFQWRYILLPSSTTNPALSVWASSVIGSGSNQPGATYQWPTTLNIPHTVMAAGVTYRVWVQLDPSGLVSERDENNNLIPLNILGSRGAGC